MPRFMTTPRRIFRIYQSLCADAELIRDFQLAMGEKASSTVTALIAKDRAKLLAKWGDEMDELCGVLDGTHDDPYLMEATQTWYWACLYAVTGGATWESLCWEEAPRLAATSGIDSVEELKAAVLRLVGLGPDAAKPEKLFLLWLVADRIYRRTTPQDQQWSIEQLMEADLQDMKKKTYLHPVLAAIKD
jgi:phosphoribosyl-ATP pyrophosphohydrolase